MLELVDELVAGTATSGGGGSAPAVIEELNVTPSTSAQTITAPSGTDGYSPVNVSAVTSSIDANIQATNIKDGVSILGVTGTLVEGGDVITATNNTGTDILAGDKVWINESSGSYKIENLVVPKMSQHFTRISSLVIDNMIASSFSRYNYIRETQHIDFTKPWEFNTAVTLGNYNDNQFIYVASNTTQANLNDAGFLLFASIGGGTFRFVGTVGFDVALSLTLSQGVLYYLKCGWTGTEYYLGVSTDGTNYTYATPYSSTTPCQATDATFNLGGNEGWAAFYLYGSLYLDKTYIINNGEVVWSPYTTDSLSGFAKEVITNGSTGEVLTLVEPKYYAYKDLLNRYVYCENIITSTQYYYNLNAKSDNGKATSISELTVPTRAKPVSVTETGAVTFNIMPYYRSEQDDLY